MIKNGAYRLGGVLLLLIIWGLIEPHLLDVERTTAEVPRLPQVWEGATVAQISDFLIGMWLDNEGTVAQAVEEVVDAQPDLVLITGDFIYRAGNPRDDLHTVATLMQSLAESGLPVYAVPGNHDYSVANRENGGIDEEMAQAVVDTLESLGVDVLRNEAVALPTPLRDDTASREPLYRVGVGPFWPGRAEVRQALQGVSQAAPRAVMMHNPRTFDEMPAESAPLTVACHTHGGQVRIPFLPHWSWIHWARPGKVHADAWAADT